MKKLYILFLLSFFTANVFAQKGYIITKNGDTTRCIVQKELIGGVKYKLTKNGVSQKIDPDSIREYQLTRDGSIYLLQYLPGTNTYVKWLEKGKINLFEEHYTITTPLQSKYGSNSISATCWYVCKNNLVLQPLPVDDLECRTYVMNLFSDNFDLLVSFRAANDVSMENIQDYIKRYNLAALAGSK